MNDDAGLQPERTSLAWRRTGLALAVGALLALRLLPSRFGGWAVVPALLGLGLAVTLLVVGQQRYRLQRERLDRVDAEAGHALAGGGTLTLLTAVTSAGLGLLGLLLLLV